MPEKIDLNLVKFRNRYGIILAICTLLLIASGFYFYNYLISVQLNQNLSYLSTQQNKQSKELLNGMFALIDKQGLKTGKKQREEVSKNLKSGLQKFEQIQVVLQQRNVDSLGGWNPSEIQTSLQKIQPQFDLIIKFAKDLTQNIEKTDVKSAEFQTQWNEINLLIQLYSNQMDKIAVLYLAESNKSQNQVFTFFIYTSILFLLALIAQSIYVFLPISKKVGEVDIELKESRKMIRASDEKQNQYLTKLQQTQELLLKKNDDFLELSAFQKSVLENQELIVLTINQDGVITSFNKCAEKILGYSAKDMVFRESVFILYDIDELNFKKNILVRQNQTAELNMMDVLISEKQTNKPNDWTYIHKNKSRLAVATKIQSLKNKEGITIGFLIIAFEITEQKLVEAKFRKNEYYFRLLSEHSRDVVALYNSKNECEYISPSIGKMTGQDPVDVCKNGLLAYIHPEDVLNYLEFEQNCVDTQIKESEYVIRLRNAEHQYQWIEQKTQRFFDPSGTLIRKIVSLYNVNESAGLNNELVDNHLFLHNIIENIPVGVSIFDKAGKLIHSNQLYHELSELIKYYTKDGNFISPDTSKEEVGFLFKEAFAGEKVSHREIKIQSENTNLSRFEFGSSLCINFSIAPISDQAREISHIIVLTENITLRKEIEDKIKQSEEDLAEAQEIAGLGNWEIDFRNHQIKWSLEMYQQFGWDTALPPPTPDEHYLRLIHPDDASLIFDAVRNATENNFVNVEQRIIRPNGEHRFLLNRARALHNAQNEWVGLYGTSLDITDRKNAELELKRKNDKITDSINYARRIQKAMLSSKEEIFEILTDSFILFKPRDIVSGDFYWFAILHNKVILAAIDCTGHGVPGAFMSMIGDSLLNQIVHDKGIYQADLILNELHKGIRKSLNQREQSGVGDGMDVVLCVIDAKQQTMEYAGAINPLYMIQGGKFIEIKGNKKPIGGKLSSADEQRVFTKHVIDISIPTTIYLCSDGFQDQFGGAENRKFMTKYFKELIFKIHDKEMTEQKQILDDTLEEWKGSRHQTDDVLIIGVRIE